MFGFMLHAMCGLGGGSFVYVVEGMEGYGSLYVGLTAINMGGVF